jgi:plastocyanin
MPAKIQHGGRFRRAVRHAAAFAPIAAALAAGLAGDVRGRVTLLDKGNRPAEDVGQAVIWLEGGSAAPAPAQAEFTPHILVVPVGSTVSFPNHDPFNHNVFSLAEEQPFDLGLYGRGETRSVRFTRPGIIRVYCNVHAQMSALVVVRDGPYVTQPAGDGSFTIGKVAPGRYTLHAWHERASEITQPLQVPAGGVDALTLTLDASGYRFKPHLNKFGQPYPQQGRRY